MTESEFSGMMDKFEVRLRKIEKHYYLIVGLLAGNLIVNGAPLALKLL